MIHEIWKAVEGYSGFYEVSNLGNVKSLYRSVPKLLSQKTDKDGYKLVSLYKCGESRTYRVHRLVATSFLPNADNLPFINHKDEVRGNNAASNLEWCTAAYNTNYGGCRNRNRDSHLGKKQSAETIKKRVAKTRKPIVQKTISGDFVAKWDGIRKCAETLGIDSSSLSKCCMGKLPHYKGFKWEYADKGVDSK